MTDSEASPQEFSGDWSDACAAYCRVLEDCSPDEWSPCRDECLEVERALPGRCQETLGEVLWCASSLTCEELGPPAHWRGTAQQAAEDPGHQCHELALEVGPDCCV